MPNFNTSQGEDSNPIRGIPVVAKLPTDIEPEKSDYNEFVQRFTLPEAYRLADGGEVRQAYGLGSLVKKVTGAAKKLLKSPVGKAALLGGLGYLGAGKLSPSIANFFGKGTLNPLTRLMDYGTASSKFGDLVSKFPGGLKGLAAAGVTLSPFLMSQKEEDEEDQLTAMYRGEGIDIPGIRKAVGQRGLRREDYPFMPSTYYAAKGGRIGYDDGGWWQE